MSKRLYIVQDAIGTVGTQMASSQARAIALFASHNPDASSDLTAYAMNGMDGTERNYSEWEAVPEVKV